MAPFRPWRQITTAAIASIALLGGSGSAYASTATISSTAQQQIKGWGCFPSYFRSDWDANSHIFNRPAIQDAIYNLGITVIRVELQPRLYVSGWSLSDMVLDTTAVDDLVNQITIARNHGVTQYIMTCYSPPAAFKDNGSVNGGHLNAASEWSYIAYYTKVLQTLNSRGVGLPVMISVQNEPDLPTSYDSCTYTDTEANKTLWRSLVKDMRNMFDTNGLSAVKIGGPECTSTDNDGFLLGGDGTPLLGSDPTLNAALGCYAIHGYSECWRTMLTNGQSIYPKDFWTMEWSAIHSGAGTDEMARAIYATRHLASNIVDLKANYWLWWRCWIYDPVNAPGDEELITGDTTPTYSKRYWIFKQLWNTVRPGWNAKTMTCDDSTFVTSVAGDGGFNGNNCEMSVDLVAFENSGATQSAVLLVNTNTTTAKTMTINGLKGSTYTRYLTDASHDMSNMGGGSVTSGSATVSLPAKSVTIVVTGASGSQANIAAGTATIDGTVEAAWNNATAYTLTKTTGTVSSSADLSGTWKGMWDTTNLYILTDVTDDLKKNDSTSPWDDDAVEIFVDGNNNKTTTYDTNDRQIVCGWGDAAPVEGAGRSITGVTFAKADPTGTTYRIEAKIPWSTLGVTASSGKLIGIDVHIDDDDDNGARDGKRIWNDGTDQAWANPSLFGTGTLLAGATLPPAPTGVVATAGNQQVVLTWNASSGATSYNVKKSTISGSGFVTIPGISGTSYTNTGLTNGTTYYYIICGVNSAGEGPGSGQVQAMPVPPNTHAGSWGVKSVFSGTPTWKNLSEVVSVASNAAYVATFWMKGTGSVTLRTFAGNWATQVSSTSFNATSTWTQYSVSFNTGANTQFTFDLEDTSSVAGTAYIDDCFMGVSGSTNKLANPGFESGNMSWSVEAGSPFSILQNP